MGKILTLSGKKQSGKNTSANFLFGLVMSTIKTEGAEHEFISDFDINEKGELIIPYAGEGENELIYSVFDPLTRNPDLRAWLADNLWCYVKIYSFADKLKEFAIDCLGLTEAQCYGSDADKQTIVPHLLWENMPTVITTLEANSWSKDGPMISGRIGPYYIKQGDLIYHTPGPMTAREVLQFFGTEIGRKMYGDIWVDATFRQIEKDDPVLAIICDGRFPNEIKSTRKRGGKTVRFTRNPNPGDTHPSEVALDPNNFDWAEFDTIIDNSNMSIDQQNESIFNILISWGWLENQ